MAMFGSAVRITIATAMTTLRLTVARGDQMMMIHPVYYAAVPGTILRSIAVRRVGTATPLESASTTLVFGWCVGRRSTPLSQSW